MIRPRIGLAVKLAGCLVLSTAGFFALFGYLNLRLQRTHFERMVLLSADRIIDILHGATRHEMLRNDRDALYNQIGDIGREPGISRVRIFNKDGLIRFSTHADEVGAMVDKKAEACYGCHAQEAPLTKLSRPDRARVFAESGQRVLAVIRPIENQPDCSNAACHAHPPDRRILGVLDAHLSLASVDTQLASQQRALVGFTALASVLACTLSITFIWLVIHKPIKALMKGTRKVASGDLTHRIPVHSVDELGDLATSFNKMTTDLEHAHSEITDWTRTLEDRVQRKSEELEQAHHTLRSSEKLASLGKLAATVAHEVNNPLFGMLTYARLSLKAIQQSSLDENTKAAMSENLRVIERESRRCGEIMRNLLTFARQAPPSRAPSDLNTLLERVIKLVGHQLDLQSIVLEKHLSSDLPQIACDSSQIQQVLLALLINATEAMPQGGTIAVSTEFDPAARAVRTLVRDSGPGIDPEILPQIWEPFFTTKENQHRTGLGLAISRGIIERHGGRIEVDTKAGAGTVFTITLPLDIGAPPATPETPWLETTRTAGV